MNHPRLTAIAFLWLAIACCPIALVNASETLSSKKITVTLVRWPYT